MVGGVLRVEGQFDPGDLRAQGGIRFHRGLTVNHDDGSRGSAAADTVEPYTKEAGRSNSVITEQLAIGVDAALVGVRAPPTGAD